MAGEEPFDLEFFLLVDFSRKTLLILDSERRIVAVLVGQPQDPEWVCVVGEATKVMQDVRRLGAEMDLFSGQGLSHRWGEFLAILVGVSFGGGQTVRTSQSLSKAHSLMNFTF